MWIDVTSHQLPSNISDVGPGDLTNFILNVDLVCVGNGEGWERKMDGCSGLGL